MNPKDAHLGVSHFLVRSPFPGVERLKISAILEKEIFRFEICVSDLETVKEGDGGYQLEHYVSSVLNGVGLQKINEIG